MDTKESIRFPNNLQNAFLLRQRPTELCSKRRDSKATEVVVVVAKMVVMAEAVWWPPEWSSARIKILVNTYILVLDFIDILEISMVSIFLKISKKRKLYKIHGNA